MNANINGSLKKKWNFLIKKHSLRFDIWVILEIHKKLNVTQITKYVEQSKSTVARHLNSMEKDGLLISKTGKQVIKGRIPPKIYQINPKYKEEEIYPEEVDYLDDLEKLKHLFKKEINNFRKVGYNITKLLDYLDPLLDLLEKQLVDIEKAKIIYDHYLSYVSGPVFLYFDKKRAQKFIDIHTEYIFKLHKLAMEEELNTKEAFVYFDMSLPLAALFELKKKLKRARTEEFIILEHDILSRDAEI
ncbi:MAG: winged helix-turn-helix domain-containing protein [Candidatus Thorarchaeota archaeon]